MNKKKYVSWLNRLCLVGISLFCSFSHLNASPEKIQIFNSLSEIQNYAQTLAEYPMPENNNWQDPDFSNLQKKLVPSCFRTLLNRLPIFSSAWSAYNFQELLEAVINLRKEQGYNGQFVQKLYHKPGSSVIIFGALYGAFHSLVRNLEFLKQEGFIDDNLKIIKPDCTIIFDGNVVAYSPYILETLTVILRLMIMNPTNIFYIRGEQEDNELWKKDGLLHELKIRAPIKHLKKRVNNFFQTLPLALYLIADQTNSQVDVIRISSFNEETTELTERNFSHFFAQPQSSIFYINQEPKEKIKAIKVKVHGYLQSDPSEWKKHRNSRGLALLRKDKQTTVWNIFSSPTTVNRALYQFFYDSFILLKTTPLLKNWTITLYDQDVRTMTGINPAAVVNLESGIEYINKEIQKEQIEQLTTKLSQQEAILKQCKEELLTLEKKEPEYKEAIAIEKPKEVAPTQEIKFGTSMDLTAETSDICKQVLAGLEVVLHNQNKKGGVNGKKISLTVLDDGYNPRRAALNIKTLMDKYKIDKILDPNGTPTLAAFFKLVEEGKILVLFTTFGSYIFRAPQYKYIIHYRASYTREVEALARYAYEKLKAKKIGLIYQSDVPSIEGALKYFKKVEFTNFFEIVYDRTDIKMDKQVDLINKENPDTLIFLTIPTAAIEIIRQTGTQKIGRKNLLGWSDLGSGLFQRFIKKESIPFIISNVVPSPLYSKLPIVKEFRKISNKHNIFKDTFALEGFICATITVEILKQIKGEVTKEKIIEVAEKFNKFDLGGIRLTFNPETRNLCHTIWLDTGTSKEWESITFAVSGSS